MPTPTPRWLPVDKELLSSGPPPRLSRSRTGVFGRWSKWCKLREDLFGCEIKAHRALEQATANGPELHRSTKIADEEAASMNIGGPGKAIVKVARVTRDASQKLPRSFSPPSQTL